MHVWSTCMHSDRYLDRQTRGRPTDIVRLKQAKKIKVSRVSEVTVFQRIVSRD
jgi:hypothetical protein